MCTIVNAHNLLHKNQYFHTSCEKKRIVLHHTAGGTAKSSINWWNTHDDRVSTPYLIDRDGTILEVFRPDFWAYALGINSSWAEKKSIHIEICNFGWLSKHNGKMFRQVGDKLIPFQGEYVEYKQPHRGHLYYEKYTDQQIASVIFLINYLSNKFNIQIKGSNVEKFWWSDRNSTKNIISHTTVRKDKSDIHPQPNLIKAIYDYAGCTAPVTE